MKFFALTPWLGLFSAVTASCYREKCVVKSSGITNTDDAPAVREAFKRCSHGGHVVFEDATYNINSPLNIRGLEDVKVDIYGTLLVC